MVPLLALVAVVGYTAKAGLPWWVVAAVALLMAGFAGGMAWSPGRGARSPTPPGGPLRPAASPGVRRGGVPVIPVDVAAPARPDDREVPAAVGAGDRALR